MRVDYFGKPLKEGDIITCERRNKFSMVKIDSFNKKDEILFTEEFFFNDGKFYNWKLPNIIKTNRIFKYTV